ncbi:hypothetical protein ZWY2020_043137 [Hordeum vulgare]|nr:hypothetical protein ZWY2020_043137 [Hordeum vulgare]
MAAEAAEAKAERKRPTPIPQLRTQAEQMAFLVSTFQGMEKNIQEIMQNQKSLERVVETKFHNMDLKVTELTTIVKQLQHEVDSMEIPRPEDEDEDEDDDEDESPPPTTTKFSTQPRSVAVPTPETRHTSSAQASAPAPAQAPSVSTSSVDAVKPSRRCFIDSIISCPERRVVLYF